MILAQMDNDERKVIPSYIFYPNSTFRQYWDIIIILFVIYNVIMIPMETGLCIY